MKKSKRLFLILLSFFCFIPTFSSGKIVFAEEQFVYIGGFSAGFSVNTEGAEIVGLSDVITEKGVLSPSKSANLNVGDIILSIDGIKTDNAFDVEKAVKDEKDKLLVVLRNKELITLNITPAKDISGKFRLGVFIRDGINGIGTVTYIKDGKFASLGHPIVYEDGSIISITGGKLYGCKITGCIKGERGNPGELKGTFKKVQNIGDIEKNMEFGVFGNVSSDFNLDKLVKKSIGEARPGDARIITTVDDNGPTEYSISIIKAENDIVSNKNIVLKITDERLVSKTGGIVQGMSGSPILQNGKIVGAVTHVFINDPSKGFGISIKNMINN